MNDLAPTPSRLVLLGASNLTKGIGLALGAARLAIGADPGDPLDVRLAYGHGRSYGLTSRVLGRRLPSIVQCGLWDDLPHDDASAFGLISDVGNDVMYGAQPAEIEGWIATCVEQLLARKTRIVMTSLPLQRLRRLRPSQFRVAKKLLFPRSPVTFEMALERCEQVNDMLAARAGAHDLSLVSLSPEWYGLDPIHIRRGARREAWGEIVAGWRKRPGPPIRPRESLRLTLAIRTTTPQRWWLLGRERGRDQPAVTHSDGTTVAMY